MALTNFKFDDTSIPFVKKESFSFSNDQTANKTEGGRNIIQKFRTDILKMNFSTRCLSDMASTYHKFSKKDSFVLTYYDTDSKTQITRTVHMENYSESLVQNSNKLGATDGIYDISFTLEEF